MDPHQNQWQNDPRRLSPRYPSQDSLLSPESPYTRAEEEEEQVRLMSIRRIPSPSVSTPHEDELYQDLIWMTPSPGATTPIYAAAPHLRRVSTDLGASPLSASLESAVLVEKKGPPSPLSKPPRDVIPEPAKRAGEGRGPPPKSSSSSSSWWWWEIGACALSLVSTVLLFVLLVKVEDIALQSWPHQIQINSVVAILTAVSRTAMVVPLAACISQLKWRHFESPNRLSHLQDYDNASRGPWGSLLILFNFRVGDLLAWALALWTVASLGISPSAQQILEFPNRRVAMRNVTATIVQAPGYWAKEGFRMYPTTVNVETTGACLFYPPDVALPFQIKLRTGLLGGSFTPDFTCPQPASECEWEDFSTLGMCADVRNVTADTKVACKLQSSQREVVCEYTHGSLESETMRAVRMLFVNSAYNWSIPDPVYTTLSSARSTPTPASRSSSSSSRAAAETRSSSPSPSGQGTPDVVIGIDAQMDKRQEPPVVPPQSLQSSNFGLAARIRSEAFNADNLTLRFDGGIREDRPPPVDVLSYDWRWCEKTLRNVSARGGELHIGAIQVKPLPTRKGEGKRMTVFGSSDDNIDIYSGNTTDAKYQVGKMSDARLKLVRGLFFNQEVTSRDGDAVKTTNTMDGLLDFGMFIYQSDFAGLAHNHAVTVDNLVHSRASNTNATERAGVAYMIETYVRVRWAWILLPVIEAVGATVLLALSIALTRHRPLLKDSALALLVYGPGWDGLPPNDDDRGREAGGWAARADVDALSKSTKGVMAVIERDGQGRPGFVTGVEKETR